MASAPAGQEEAWRRLRRAAPLSLPSNASRSSAAHGPDPTIAPYTIGLAGVDTHTDYYLRCVLLGTMGALAVGVLLMRLQQLALGHIRHLLAMHASPGQQAYFARNNARWPPRLKKHVVYAPVFRKRHNRELRLSAAVNVGTLPSRLQAVLLGLYVLSNLAYCTMLDYSVANRYQMLAQLRGRSGTLAVANMVPLVLLAGRNNPLISLLHVSFDTYNLLHRWMGRIVVLESVVHTTAWAVSRVASAQWQAVWADMKSPFMLWGGVAVAAAILLACLSPSPVRHAFYETFLTLHILLAVAAVAGTYLHCSIDKLPPLPYVQAAAALWIMDRLLRFVRILRHSLCRRRGWTKADIRLLPGDACRVTLHLASHLDIKPGTHAYLRFVRLNIWESHPFSIAWTEEHLDAAASAPDDNTKDGMELDMRKAPTRTSVSFVIHAKTGLTRRLVDFAAAHESGEIMAYTLFEGPYAGHHSLDSYGHVVLFAGSSGITHQLPHVRHLISGYQDGTVAIQRIVLVWVIREVEHMTWAQPWLSTLLTMAGGSGIFDPRIFVTKPKSDLKLASEGDIRQVHPGRPKISHIINQEVKQQIGAMCVTVCGPGAIADDVRRAVRDVQHLGFVDFIEESFTW